ncbi:MAG: carboxypeptidase-like regulatory domain-containing protein, partial [Thermoplasmata archaeon]|nr:carboxypeptidase-like regulatory domain-containing protein [Thermoplasmata archaeon]
DPVPGRRSVGGSARIARWAIVPLLALLVLGSVVAAPAPKIASGPVLAITQSTRVSEQQAFTVSVQVADPANVTDAYFLFCQLTSSVCYLPVTMTLHGTNWFVGTTKPMSSYHGMAPGVVAGYNISLDYRDGVNLTYPSLPNTFGNLTVATTVVNEYMYEMSVAPLVFGLSGVVHDSSTGAAVAGATVTLANSSGATNSTTSGSTGAYSFGSLPNGTYQLSVSEHGYETSSQSVTIAGLTATANVPLTNTTSKPHPASTSWWSSLGPSGQLSLEIVPVVVVLVAAIVVVSWAGRRANVPRPKADDPTESSPPGPA